MRRRLLTYILLAAVTGAVLWACQRDRFGHDDPNAVKPTLTISEAQSIFERQMSQAMPALTKLSNDRPVGLMPGDFTPLWNKARIGANREMDGADVPINPHYIHVAVFRRLTLEGDTLYRTVDVIQKLVVKKWRDTSDFKAYSYIASIVPTPEYYAKHKNVGKEFQYGGGKGVFSGFVLYHTLDGRLVSIDNFRDGKHTRHDYFPVVNEQNADSVGDVMALTLGSTRFQSGTFSDFEEDMETLVPDEEVTVTAHGPWYKPIIFFPGTQGGGYVPTPIEYNPPYVNTGGGGSGGSIVQLTGKPKAIINNCGHKENSVKTASGTLFAILKSCPANYYGSPTFDQFMSTVKKNSDVEHSTVLKQYSDNLFSLGPIYTADGPDDFANVESNVDNIAMIHSHPDSHLTAPSPLDVMALGDQIAKGNERMQAGYVVVGDDIYCLQVTDPSQAEAFYISNRNEKSDGSPVNSNFRPGSTAATLWETGDKLMRTLENVPQDEIDLAILAYVLEKGNAGVVVCKMNSSKTQFVPYGIRPNRKGDIYPTRCQ